MLDGKQNDTGRGLSGAVLYVPRFASRNFLPLPAVLPHAKLIYR